MTPLHYAASNGHLSVVEYLVNQKDDIYWTHHQLIDCLYHNGTIWVMFISY